MSNASNQVIQDDQVEIDTNEIKEIEEPTNEGNSDSIEALKEELKVRDEWAQKNREENRKFRTQKKQLKAEIDEMRKQLADSNVSKMKEKDQYEPLYKSSLSRIEQLEQENKALIFEKKGNQLQGVVRDIAKEMGCIDDSLAFHLLNTKYASMVDYDEESLNAEPSSIRDAMEKMKLDSPYVFSQGRMNLNDTKPNRVSVKDRGLKDLSTQEKIELFRKKNKS